VYKIGETEDARQAKTQRLAQDLSAGHEMLKWDVLNDWKDWSCRLSANGLNVWNYLNAKRLPAP